MPAQGGPGLLPWHRGQPKAAPKQAPLSYNATLCSAGPPPPSCPAGRVERLDPRNITRRYSTSGPPLSLSRPPFIVGGRLPLLVGTPPGPSSCRSSSREGLLSSPDPPGGGGAPSSRRRFNTRLPAYEKPPSRRAWLDLLRVAWGLKPSPVAPFAPRPRPKDGGVG